MGKIEGRLTERGKVHHVVLNLEYYFGPLKKKTINFLLAFDLYAVTKSVKFLDSTISLIREWSRWGIVRTY